MFHIRIFLYYYCLQSQTSHTIAAHSMQFQAWGEAYHCYIITLVLSVILDCWYNRKRFDTIADMVQPTIIIFVLSAIILMCDVTHSFVWHDSLICVMRDVTHSYVWHDSHMCGMCCSSWYTRTALDTIHTRSALQHSATLCNTLQHTATNCNTLQHTATHCNTRTALDTIKHMARSLSLSYYY